MIDLVELFQHWHSGRRIGELSSSLGLDPKTVRKYLTPAMAAGIVPGGPPLSIEQWAVLTESWFPELVDRSKRQTTWPEITPHHERIKNWDCPYLPDTLIMRPEPPCGGGSWTRTRPD